MYALITHKSKGDMFNVDETVWYIGIVDNGKAKPIPEFEAEKICTLLNTIMQIPEGSLKTLLEGMNDIIKKADNKK